MTLNWFLKKRKEMKKKSNIIYSSLERLTEIKSKQEDASHHIRNKEYPAAIVGIMSILQTTLCS